MLDTPGMQILAACCAPVFVKFLEELFPYSVGKQNCLTKKCNCFLKTCQILCPHEWVGFIWSWVLTNCRNEHAHAQGHTHTQLHGSKVVTTPYLHIQVVPFPRTHLFIYLSIHIYIYTHVYTNIVNHTLYIVYACAFIFANIDLLCIYIYIHMCVCVLLKTPAHEVHFAFFRVLRTVVKCFPFFVPARSLEPMLPRIWGLCARLLHAIYLFML